MYVSVTELVCVLYTSACVLYLLYVYNVWSTCSHMQAASTSQSSNNSSNKEALELCCTLCKVKIRLVVNSCNWHVNENFPRDKLWLVFLIQVLILSTCSEL